MKVIHFETIDSTNTYLKNNYENLDNMTIVSADIQTAGRGRNNRKWTGSKGKNLLLSLLIKDKEIIKKYKKISIISAYSILQALKDYNLNNLSIKWPNDVYLDEKKICGILLEAITKNDIECLIVGIGINVNEETFDGEYLHQPISMKNKLNKDIDINELKEIVCSKLINNINSDLDFYQDITKYDYLKDKQVNISINNEIKEVYVLGIDKDYSLKVKDNNKIINIDSGEVTFHI